MRLGRANAPGTRRRRPGRRSRAMSAAVALLAVATLVAGCATVSGSGSTVARRVSITVAAVPGVGDAPLYIAAAKGGLFSKAGLNVTIQPYQSVSEELKALESGRVDVAAGDYANFLYAAATSRRSGLRIVADGYHAAPGVMEVLARPDSDITSPQDLVGKTIGTAEPQGIPLRSGAPFSLETIATQSVLQNDGVSPTRVKWKPLPQGELINALANRQVDAILVQEPYILEAESELGAIEVLDSCSGATASLPLSGYFSVASYARKDPEALRAFRSALQQAQADAVLPGPVHAVLVSHSGMSMQSASLITIGSYPTSLDPAGLQRVADLMFNFGVIVTTYEVAPLVFH
jgi:NitT/TauT family transport system substrate-binding protein